MKQYRTQTQPTVGIWLKSLLFNLFYALFAMVHGPVSLIVCPVLPMKQRHAFVNLWTRFSMWLLKHLNGVEIEVIGLDNIPKDACVVVANHQSSWETFYLQLVISPQATILKRELLWVPFWGWGLAMLKPITINRSKATSALKEIIRQGKSRLAENIPVVIYPEGTRHAPGTPGPFNVGGAMLACQAGVDLLPIAHNGGECWPARSMLRTPGKITLVIGPPISSHDKKPKQLNVEAEQWVKTTLESISHY